jgi:undecaprenyl-diphosphatase
LTFLAILAGHVFPDSRIWAVLAGFTAWTIWARVYIGDHWFSDVLGGLALGTAAGCAALAWIEWRRGYDRSR